MATGYLTKEEAMAMNDFSEEAWENTHLLTDPLSLESLLGADGSLDHPSLCRMMEEAQNMRMRYVWVMTGKGEPRGGNAGYIPEAMSFPLEKRLCQYLAAFSRLSVEKQEALPRKASLLWNCQRQCEADPRTLKKTTIADPNGPGLRVFVDNIATHRGSKDWCCLCYF